MPNDESQGDDVILERLRESASGDAAVRQLRRRYDLLRNDYEQLLDRLGELEDRLNADPSAGNAAAAPPPTPAAASSSLADMILAPLLKLRDDYVEAVTGINSVVSGLESLAAGAFKGQHGGESGLQPATPQPVAHHVDEAVSQRPRRLQVDVRGRGFGELLDFQERLSTLEGVARVSINAIDTERATLVVELNVPGQRTPDD